MFVDPWRGCAGKAFSPGPAALPVNVEMQFGDPTAEHPYGIRTMVRWMVQNQNRPSLAGCILQGKRSPAEV